MTIDRLRSILELEQHKGYRDQAVIGGLDKFLRNVNLADPVLSQLLSQSYSTLAEEQRVEWIRSVLEQLDTSRPEAQRSFQPAAHKPESPSQLHTKSDIYQKLDAPITSIKGVKTSMATKFGKLGVETVRQLLYLFPRRHIDYSQRMRISELEQGKEQTIVATVWSASEKKISRGRRTTEAIVGDESGNMRIVWFNQPYLARSLPVNGQVAISGKVSLFQGRKVFESPEWEPLESGDLIHTGRLVPVYPLTSGLSQRGVRKLVRGTIDSWLPQLPDFLPESTLKRAELLPLSQAIRQAHYPDNEFDKERARKRLVFDELFLIQLGVLSKKREWQEEQTGNAFIIDNNCLAVFFNSLPFTMTAAQERVLTEIEGDLTRSKPMSRLLQGEVGSGKTVIATAAMLLAVANGYQAAIMAPTEILAEQHFSSICNLLGNSGTEHGEPAYNNASVLPSPVRVGLLTGSLRESSRQELLEGIASGEIDIVVGTHALIQKGVEFSQLGLCVADEQHRFGVMQRSLLRSKGVSPHVLVMSATPIPRTLALTLYGDLDLSVIDELPAGRTEIKTKWLRPEQRQSAYNFVRKQIATGRQAFIVCPLIEESDTIESRAAITEYERLSHDIFPDLRVGLLHGRLSSTEKDEVMQLFRSAELDILVSTPVVEVGVDIPNATVMLIEGADRFGLAQLHQFRGRVGRGEHQSYCLLLSESPSIEAMERLSLLEQTRDGFALAEEDLRLRGPGEFFGTRQSGLPDLKMAKLSDVEILELARSEAMYLFHTDPNLQQPQNRLLAQEVGRLWNKGGELN